MSSVLPGSGFGPKGRQSANWRWGLTVDALTVGGHRLRVEVEGEGHPGYYTTATMLGEAGLLLAEPDATPSARAASPRRRRSASVPAAVRAGRAAVLGSA